MFLLVSIKINKYIKEMSRPRKMVARARFDHKRESVRE